MDVKLVLLILGLLVLLDTQVEADFFYNAPTAEETKARGLKCIPGRTVIKIGQDKDENDDDEEDTRRTHMNTHTNDETCKICVCSTEGKDEYCSKRPARNVNECIRISLMKKSKEKSMPFEHERSLSFRIRRDYIWHYDEIPYEAKASCKRSASYYSNSINANDTDIDVATDIDSLLDYSNSDICYFCVCSVDGKHAGCIARNPWFCEYYRVVRKPNAARDRYEKLFQQDRPAYFRQISYRLRRTMDDGLFTFYDAGGDTLCCNHPNGHRRTLHEQVRTKIRLMRKKMPKENILSRSPTGDYVDFIVNNDLGEDTLNSSKCVPFVSEYSDCTEANHCSGCNRCRCTAEGEWSCEEVFMCPVDEDEPPTDQDTVITALGDVQSFIEKKRKEKKKPPAIVPPPPNPEDELIVPEQNPYEENFETWLSRQKRSVKEDSGEKSNENTTVKFFHTVDEVNEDTLKSSNKSGTIEAQKMHTNQIPKISRRTILSDNFNKSALSSLHIEYNQLHDYDPHIAENKIDAASHITSKIYEKELQKLIGNYSQGTKDKDLSKLVVNELKAGNEIIGDKNVPPTSNITFTPENDTLTAMAFIAGNLLSKLWDMEKDAGDDSIETDVLKHEKINDLLELFKEPLSIRQETFLKNALEKLSESLNKNKSVKNISFCQTITDYDTFHENGEKSDINKTREINHNKTKCQQAEQMNKPNDKENQYNITVGVVSKLNNVLGLIKKFESVQQNLKNMKQQTSTDQNNDKHVIDTDIKPSFELFGTLLDKITKLLIPNKSKSKKLMNKLKSSYQFANKSSVSNIFEDKFNINVGKINMTTKDKLVLDYLNHIESNPNCLFKSNFQKSTDSPIMNIEGNILYNLSEFFKIKSFIDLMKLANPETETTTKQQNKPTTRIPNEANILRNGMSDGVTQPSSTKEKLKAHLKAIIDDVKQLQQESGVNNVKNVNVMDALPCIYKILNGDTVLNDQYLQKKKLAQASHLDKLKSLIDTLKIEFNLPTRRSNSFVPQEMTQSAKVWERMIKNINSAQKNTRRSFNSEKPKNYEELKDIMEKVELMGNTYKNFAILSEIPPHKRLMLLKTLEADTKQQSFALANIKKSVDTFDSLPLEKTNEIKEFIENVGSSVKLSTKVLKNIEKLKQNTNKKSEVELLSTKTQKQASKLPKPLNLHKDSVEFKSKNIKLSRDQILNQLITNRVLLYLKSKEASGAELNDDMNYNIGKRIIFLIQSGNMNVAKELFRIFVDNKQKEEKRSQIKDSKATFNHFRKRAPLLATPNEPIMRFNRPGKEMEKQTSQDDFKQLLF